MTTMNQALKNAVASKYIPTTHAIDRAQARFGIPSEQVGEWVTSLMDKAIFVSESGAQGCSVYETDGVRLVVNEGKGIVVTVHHAISTDFLTPVLEREKRKLYRKHIRETRSLELAYANALRDMSDMAINRAKARNPKTRELIAERMSNKQAEICDYVSEIERLTSEYEARVRVMEMISE